MTPVRQEENLQKLESNATLMNRLAVYSTKLEEYQEALIKTRLTLECICIGIFFINNREPNGNLNRQIEQLNQLGFIGNKIDDFKRLKNLGNLGAHINDSLSDNKVNEARQLLNNILRFFYEDILEISIPSELQNIIQLSPIKELQIEYKNLYPKLVFNDVPLAKIYVVPHITFWKHSISTDSSKGFSSIPSCSDLHQFTKHFDSNELETHYKEIKFPSSQMLILLGAPGQGKTSFCKRVLHDLLSEQENTDRNIYYLKLRDIDNTKFLESPFSYLIENKILPQTIAKDLEKALIILDGLDELYLHNGGHLSQVDTFIDTLLNQLNKTRYKNAKIILTSRFGYLSLNKFHAENNLIIASIDTFNEDQQIEWLIKYQSAAPDKKISLTPDKIKEIHTEILFQKPLVHFKELFEQPVLLHLFVLSGLEVNTQTKRTQIYNQLFEKLSHRSWEQDPFNALKRIRSRELKEVSKAIAFEMYKNNKAFLNKTALNNIPAVQDFYEKIEITAIQQKKELYRYLFIAFYWQKKTKEESEVLEFLHKSLQEYLIAEKIWDIFQEIETATCSSAKDALDILWSIPPNQMISKEIQEVLVEIISNDSNNHRILLKKMIAYFPALCKKQFMQKCLDIEPMRAGINTFYLYQLVLVCLNKNINTTHSLEKIDHLKFHYSDVWRDLFLISQHYCGSNRWELSYSYLESLPLQYGLNVSKIEFSILKGVYFNSLKFVRTSFDHSTFEKVNLTDTTLESCSLVNGQFNRLNASNINFSRCDFRVSKFKKGHFRSKSGIHFSLFSNSEILEVDFYEVSISRTSFENAIFYSKEKTSFYETQFRQCSFYGCSFTKSHLEGVLFKGAKMQGNSFTKAFLTKTNFAEVILDLGYLPNNFNTITDYEEYGHSTIDNSKLLPVSFDQAKGDRTNFSRTEMKGTSFRNVRLNTANFNFSIIKPDWRSYQESHFIPNFEDANLAYSSFKSAKLYAVNFKNADLRFIDFKNVIIENYTYESYNNTTHNYEEAIIHTSFENTNLEGASFEKGKLTNLTFLNTNLKDVDFSGADLSGCNFSNLNLQNVNFSCTILKGVNFESADLRKVMWFHPHSQLLQAVKSGDAEFTSIVHTSYLQIKPTNPNQTHLDLFRAQLFEQLKTVKSLHNAKGIPPLWKEILIQKGYSHLFEALKVCS